MADTVYTVKDDLLASVNDRIYTNLTNDIKGDIDQQVRRDVIVSLWANSDLKMAGPTSPVTDGALMVFDGTTGLKAKAGGEASFGDAAFKNIGVTPGTVMAGDDSRLDGIPNPNTVWLSPVANKTGYGTYDLEQVYGLNTHNGSMMLNQLYSLEVAKSKFAAVFQWYGATGGAALTDTQIMTMRHGTACHNEGVMQGYHKGTPGIGRCDSQNIILWPYGVYHHNASMLFDTGQYIGKGTEATYTEDSGGTCHVLDREHWLDDPALCYIMKDSLGDGAWNTYSYLEGTFIDQMRFDGLCDHKAHDPSYDSAGISFRGPGEAAVIGTVKTNGFNGCGLRFQASTPVYVHYLSSFSNTLGGVGLYGGAQSTYNFGTLSCDDNTTIFYVRDFQGQRSGGIVNVGFIKHETNTTARWVKDGSGVLTFPRGQIVVDADGFTGPNGNEGSNINIVIGNCTVTSQTAQKIHSMFAIRGFQDGVPADYVGPRKARVKVNGVYHYNVDNFLQDIGAQKQWPQDQDFNFTGFTWNASTGILSRDAADGAVPASTPQTSTKRLGSKPTGSSWDDVPAFDPTFGGTVSPDDPFSDTEYIACGVLPSQIHVSETAKAYAQPIDMNYRLNNTKTPIWYCSGPATIDSSTGVVTPTGVGLVTISVAVDGGLYQSGSTILNVIA